MANIATKFGLGGGGGGFFGNQNPPKYMTGASYLPHGFANVTSSGIVATSTRCYYVPFAVQYAHTFAGVKTKNSGAGDSGKKYRVMVFNDDGANGGPGTLAKDFGEVTLTAAAAVRTLSSSWTATPGMYWIAIWFETDPSMVGMTQPMVLSGVGLQNGPNLGHFVGSLESDPFATANVIALGYYVDTAYGTAPSTAVAPTASLVGAPSAVPLVPSVSLVA